MHRADTVLRRQHSLCRSPPTFVCPPAAAGHLPHPSVVAGPSHRHWSLPSSASHRWSPRRLRSPLASARARARLHKIPPATLYTVLGDLDMHLCVVTPVPHVRAGVRGGEARAEKVGRYKEKRQGWLFVKRIRYEVRWLNAVKRPRLKVPPMTIRKTFSPVFAFMNVQLFNSMQEHLGMNFSTLDRQLNSCNGVLALIAELKKASSSRVLKENFNPGSFESFETVGNSGVKVHTMKHLSSDKYSDVSIVLGCV
ncbi:hypothetical protein GUJ93_ZPchr0006g44599 [Zizania palustris]|uniref:CCT domain-containing protein n=1 Tax=Zizania palustris TaxID=103762 RepID=A0A8J5VXH4_ZIZPA|nr:hypothetical protein GUJ93_ZPchr0006g44599 [Zizania palustris]